MPRSARPSRRRGCLDWLHCENHHDVLIATGDAVRDRLLDVASRHPDEFDVHRPF